MSGARVRPLAELFAGFFGLVAHRFEEAGLRGRGAIGVAGAERL